MTDTGVTLLTIGGILLLGLVTDFLGRHTPLPRVTFLIILGVIIAPDALDILPDISHDWFEGIADMALVASQRFPDVADTVIPVVIASTVFFEIAGPMATRLALNRAGEMTRG